MKPQIDPDRSPMHFEHRPDPFLLRLQFGVGGGVLLVVVIIGLLVNPEMGIWALVLYGFGAVAVINLLIAVWSLGYRKEILFIGDRVRVNARNLFQHAAWEEALTAFSGVTLREEQRADPGVGNTVATVRYQVIELSHPDPLRCIPLWVEEGVTPPRELQKRFAARLGLAALAEDVSGPIVRAVGALDAKLAGRREPAADPGPVPREVEIARDGDATTIVMRAGAGSALLTWASVAGSLALFLWVLYNMVGAENFMVVSLGLGAGGVILGLISYGFYRLLRAMGVLGKAVSETPSSSLRIAGDRIEVVSNRADPPAFVGRVMHTVTGRDLFSDAPPTSIAVTDVEQIRVERQSSYIAYSGELSDRPGYRSSNSYVLLIEANDGQLAFHGNGERKCLEWLRRYLEYRVVNGVEPPL